MHRRVEGEAAAQHGAATPGPSARGESVLLLLQQMLGRVQRVRLLLELGAHLGDLLLSCGAARVDARALGLEGLALRFRLGECRLRVA